MDDEIKLHVAAQAWFRWWATDGVLALRVSSGQCQEGRRLPRNPRAFTAGLSGMLAAPRAKRSGCRRIKDGSYKIGPHRYAADRIGFVMQRHPKARWHDVEYPAMGGGGMAVAVDREGPVAVLAALKDHDAAR